MDPTGFALTCFGRDEEAQVETKNEYSIITPGKAKNEFRPNASQWQRIAQVYHKKQHLLTPGVFHTTLEKNPPAFVVQQMLKLAPQLASLPSSGPTALQVAVQSGASVEVVRILLEACPFALCVLDPLDAMYPLAYTKLHRPHEVDLIDILSRPLSYWVSQSTFQPVEDRAKADYKMEEVSSSSPPSNSIPSFFPVSKPKPMKTGAEAINVGSVDKQELNNVKALCAQVLKGHKKLTKEIKSFQSELKAQAKESSKVSAATARLIMEVLQAEQKKNFRYQSIALDMKERAFNARADKMEETCLHHCNEHLKALEKSMTISNPIQDISEMKLLLDNEILVNAQFRKDFSQWIEDRQNGDEKENQQYFGQEVVLVENDEESSYIFATNLGEVDECAPLNTTSMSSSDEDSDDSKMVEPPTSPTRGSCEIRRRKHPWNPLIRKWDRISL